jgi:hypothetical protein
MNNADRIWWRAVGRLTLALVGKRAAFGPDGGTVRYAASSGI